MNGPARRAGDDLVLAVHVVPRSARTGIDGIRDGRLVVRVSAAPIDGRANQELVAVLAEAFDVPRSMVRITGGAGGRRKVVRIEGLRHAPDIAALAGANVAAPQPPAFEPLARGWYLQVAAPTSPAAAAETLRTLRGSGLVGTLQRAIVDGIEYYRVLIGPYSSRPEAEAVAPEVVRLGTADGRPFVRKAD